MSAPDTPPAAPQFTASHWIVLADPDPPDLEQKPGTQVLGREALALGEARYRAGAYGEAASIFARMCEADPGDYGATRLLGLCRLRLGDPAGALNLLAKAHAAAPADPY